MSESWKLDEAYVDGLIERSEVIEMDCFDCCTVVVMKLPNGYALVEKSGTIDPREYDPALGRQICYRRLRGKVLELEGYIRKGEWHKAKMLAAKARQGNGETQELKPVKAAK